MFVKTVKVKKPNPLALGIILIIVLAIIAIWVIKGTSRGIGNKYKLPTNTERVSFLQNLGWKVSDKDKDVKVVKIPEKFSMVYTAYNKMQKQQGFDLAKHKGHSVEIYTYDVYNYPNKSENVVAHLIICDKVLIGGDVSCTELDGFMQGLMPTKQEDTVKGEQTTKLETATEGKTVTDKSKKTTTSTTGKSAKTTQTTKTSKSANNPTGNPSVTNADKSVSTGAVVVEQDTVG